MSNVLSLSILLVGVSLVLVIFIRTEIKRISLPAIIGFILLGFLYRLIDLKFTILTEEVSNIFEFLAKVGIITLLFRIGLESNLGELLSQLKRASFIGIGNILISGGLAFIVSWLGFGLSLITSLFIAIALTATSVGISMGIWKEMDAVHTAEGKLLLDVAELDDISGIVLMALLFSIAPSLQEGTEAIAYPVLLKQVAWILAKLILFGVFCALFSLLIEEPLTKFFQTYAQPPNLMLVIVGVGFIMAALAGLLGFSVAIGAFFAGVVFSRDPDAVKIDASFEALHDLFSPFFFIGIGLSIAPNELTTSLGLGIILAIVAILGKVLGGGIPTYLIAGPGTAALLGISLIPRSEIAMVVMQRGLNLGIVSEKVFAAMVFVSAITCIITPFIVQFMLKQKALLKKD